MTCFKTCLVQQLSKQIKAVNFLCRTNVTLRKGRDKALNTWCIFVETHDAFEAKPFLNFINLCVYFRFSEKEIVG